GFTVASSAKTVHIPVRQIDPSDAIYMHEFSFDNDFKGIAPIEAAFRHAQLGVEIVETQVAFMQNRAIPAAIVQPADEKVNPPDEKERDRLQKMLQNIYMGARNAGRTLIQRFRFEWIQLQSNFDDVEFQTHYEQSYEAVSIGFDMPVSLIRESASNFAQQREVRLDWAQSWLVPRVEWYGEQYTEQLANDGAVIQRYGTGLIVVPDTTNVALLKEDDKGKIERTNMKVQGGYKDLYTAALDTGEKNPPESLKGKYMWNGVPTPIEQIDTLWQSKLPQPTPVADSSVPQSALGQVNPALPPPPSETPAGVAPEPEKEAPPSSGKPIALMIGMANDPELIDLQNKIKTRMGDMPIKWNTPDTFHVTLVYAPAVTDMQIESLKFALEKVSWVDD
ncbi:MAG: phage portal protein, partial [Anaerolineae bacterium]|nr:phage portal protein [Anaerolineae bacterium]